MPDELMTIRMAILHVAYRSDLPVTWYTLRMLAHSSDQVVRAAYLRLGRQVLEILDEMAGSGLIACNPGHSPGMPFYLITSAGLRELCRHQGGTRLQEIDQLILEAKSIMVSLRELLRMHTAAGLSTSEASDAASRARTYLGDAKLCVAKLLKHVMDIGSLISMSQVRASDHERKAKIPPAPREDHLPPFHRGMQIACAEYAILLQAPLAELSERLQGVVAEIGAVEQSFPDRA